MPVQTRPTDAFTRDNLLLGLPIVEFTPLVNGVYGVSVPLGILSSASLEKVVEVLQLPRGDSGLIVVERELVSRLELNFSMETFNFEGNIAQYIFGSDIATAVSANPTQAVTDDPVTLLASSTYDTFLNLTNSLVSEASVALEAAQNVAEAVGTGNGVLGVTGDFSLKFKVKAAADVTSFTVGGVAKTVVAGTAPAVGQVGVVIGEGDTPAASRSGNLTFNAGDLPPVGAALVATYKPSFIGADYLLNTDFRVDPVGGRVRFINAGAGVSPFRPVGQPFLTQTMLIDYTYNKLAHTLLNPGAQTQFEGKATIKQLTDVGVNFIWTIPRAGVRITDDALEFSAEDFATATLLMNILNNGGSAPFGTIQLTSESDY